MQFENIADTAFWIAGFRAQETERPDAVFHDVLAKKLAGARGAEMVANTPGAERMAFSMVIRTTSIDQLAEHAVERGVDTIINLGAGLDTRPYRLRLPADLNWIEVDFPNIIDYKNTKLADEKPVCNLSRIAFDLSDEIKRKAFLLELGDNTKQALVITEGLISYLSSEKASQLSKDIFEVPSFKYWIHDYSQGKFRRLGRSRKWEKLLENTPIIFDVDNPIMFFSKDGWKVVENIHILDEADRLGRKLPLAKFPWTLLIRLFPKWARKTGNNTYGCVMYGR